MVDWAENTNLQTKFVTRMKNNVTLSICTYWNDVWCVNDGCWGVNVVDLICSFPPK